MSAVERAGLAVLRRIDPEAAHLMSLWALRAGLVPLAGGPVTTPRLATRLAGIELANPVGLAAGFDKNAVAVGPLSRAGFGFLEVGAATPRPQGGNPRPRLFRLPEARAAINRFGFNNDGMAAICARLAGRVPAVPVGLNLGANKDSDDRAADFALVYAAAAPHIAFATLNVSSPNTERLRDLQGPAALRALLRRLAGVRATLVRPVPLFLKIAPDLEPIEIEAIAMVAAEEGADAIVATNTTLARDGLTGAAAAQKGGLSGAPLFDRATRVLARLSRATEGRLPLIGVGGVGSAEDAYAKIRAGASAVQLYTALAYQGLSLAARIATGLDALLARDGFASLAEAVGSDRDRWLSPRS